MINKLTANHPYSDDDYFHFFFPNLDKDWDKKKVVFSFSGMPLKFKGKEAQNKFNVETARYIHNIKYFLREDKNYDK